MFFKSRTFYKELVKNYGVRSFFWRCFLWLLIVLLPFSLGLGFIVVKLNNQTLNQSLIIQSNDVIRNAVRDMDDIFVSIDRIQSEFVLDINLEIFLSKEFSPDREYVKQISNITRTMDNYILSLGGIDSIYIYNLNTDFVISNSGFENAFASNFSDMDWYEQYKTEKKGIFVRSVKRRGNLNETEQLYVTCCKSLFYNNREEAIIVYNTKYDVIENIFDKAGIEFNIFYENEKEFYPYGRKAEPDQKAKNFLKKIKAGEEAEQGMDNDAMVSIYDDATGLYIIAQNKSIVTQRNHKYVFTLIWFSMLMIVVSLIFAFFLTAKIYSAIVRIITAIQHPEQYKNKFENEKNDRSMENVNERLRNFVKTKIAKEKKQDEISYIINRFLGVNDKNYAMEAQLAISMKDLKEAQSVALQTQFTPHFLFNTLQVINLIEMKKNTGETEVMKIVSLLSQLLRYTLDSKDYLVPLETELEYLCKYIEIQSYKYNGDIVVHWDIEEDILDIKCIKFILQPIVENSFHYGISTNEKGGEIYISAKTENDDIVIKVKNNGESIAEKKCREINREIEKIAIRRKNSFGLLNVNHRIKLLCGNDYGCQIGIEENMTTVTLKLPQIRGSK